MTLRVVTFKWHKPGYRSCFTGEHVNVLRRMVARHYASPHEFVCITDDAEGLDPAIRVIPLWDDFAHLRSPNGSKRPNCYRRLKLFSPEAAEIIGPRFVVLDLDMVVTGDLTPLFDRQEDFVIWGDTNPKTYYNGSMVLMSAGARRQVWDDFDPVRSPSVAKAAGQYGSDQAWISYRLGRGEAMWSTQDGVYSYALHVRPSGGELPRDARLVVFHGSTDPWMPEAQQHDWVRAHWR